MTGFNEDIFTFNPEVIDVQPEPLAPKADQPPGPNIAEHRRWIWNQIGRICNESKLDRFRERFENDIARYPDYREIAGEVRELIQARKKIIREKLK